MVSGAVGALLGSLIGVAVIVLLGQLGYVAVLSGIVLGVCTLKGYELMGGRLSVKGTLQIGEVNGVIPAYLTDCWRYFREKSELIKSAELKIEPIGAVTYCEDCGETYSTLDYKKVCPYCGSEKTYLLTGNEFNIKEIEAC